MRLVETKAREGLDYFEENGWRLKDRMFPHEEGHPNQIREIRGPMPDLKFLT